VESDCATAIAVTFEPVEIVTDTFPSSASCTDVESDVHVAEEDGGGRGVGAGEDCGHVDAE